MTTTVDQLVHEATRSAVATTFIPTRYPYTYAADFLRQFPHVVPVDAGPVPLNMSRSDASQIRRRWAEVEGRDDDEFAQVLADAYLRVHGIEKREY